MCDVVNLSPGLDRDSELPPLLSLSLWPGRPAHQHITWSCVLLVILTVTCLVLKCVYFWVTDRQTYFRLLNCCCAWNHQVARRNLGNSEHCLVYVCLLVGICDNDIYKQAFNEILMQRYSQKYIVWIRMINYQYFILGQKLIISKVK